jgi:hypothetical protein
MINSFRKLKALPILLMILTAACSTPTENGAEANRNSAQQSGVTTPQPTVAQNGTPTATGNANGSISLPPDEQAARAQATAPAADGSAKPGEKAQTALSGGTPAERAPKLLVRDKKLDFGNQPQDKTLARTFQIKNVGDADLKIESVTPG